MIPDVFNLKQLDNIFHCPAMFRFFSSRPSQMKERGKEAVFNEIVSSGQEVVQRGQSGIQLNILKCPGYAKSRDCMGGCFDQILAIEKNLTTVGPVKPAHGVQQTGLPCSIGPITPSISPFFNSRLTSCRDSSFPKRKLISLISKWVCPAKSVNPLWMNGLLHEHYARVIMGVIYQRPWRETPQPTMKVRGFDQHSMASPRR